MASQRQLQWQAAISVGDSNGNNVNNKRNNLNGFSIDPQQSSSEQFGNYECKFEIKHEIIVPYSKFSYDGEYAAYVSIDSIIELYDVYKIRYGTLKQKIEKYLTKSNLSSKISKIKPLASRLQKVNCIASCNDNKEILLLSFDKQTFQSASILSCKILGLNTIISWKWWLYISRW